MKYTNKISMFRIHEHLGHQLLAIRKCGIRVQFFQPSLFKMDRILIHNKYVPSLKQLGYTKNEDYNDWVPFQEIPNHIPEFQWFSYYVALWEKHKNEV
jgi:hypothetical protein